MRENNKQENNSFCKRYLYFKVRRQEKYKQKCKEIDGDEGK